jgi:hypothetical protein
LEKKKKKNKKWRVAVLLLLVVEKCRSKLRSPPIQNSLSKCALIRFSFFNFLFSFLIRC